MTFQRFEDHHQQAYDKLGMMLDLMSGARQDPLQGSDFRMHWYVIWILMIVVPALYRAFQHQLRRLRAQLRPF